MPSCSSTTSPLAQARQAIPAAANPAVVSVWEEMAAELLRAHPLLFSPGAFATRLFVDQLPLTLANPDAAHQLLRAFHLLDGLQHEPKNTRALVDDVGHPSTLEETERVVIALLTPMLERPLPAESFQKAVSSSHTRSVIQTRHVAPHAVIEDIIAIAPRVVVAKCTENFGLAFALRRDEDARFLGRCRPHSWTPSRLASAAVENEVEQSLSSAGALSATAIARVITTGGYVVEAEPYSQRLRVLALGI